MKAGLMLGLLKQKLTQAGDFSEVMHFFFDISCNPEFVDLGEAVRDRRMESLLAHIGAQLFPGSRAVRLDNLLLVEIKEHGFIHGSFMINGRLGNVFWFEDIDTGLMAVLMGGETKFTRFRTQSLRQPPKPSPN